MARVEIAVRTTPSVNHAMVANGMAFVRRVAVRWVEALVPLRDVAVDLSVTDSFGRVLSRPFVQRYEVVDPAEGITLEVPGLRLDGGLLASVEEEGTAELTTTVRAGGVELATTHTPLRLLAARQWSFDPDSPVLSLELLAAFVQPNHPAVRSLVSEAAGLLARQTGSGSLALAGASPERLDAIVHAMFDALVARGIYYAPPPASWGYGQKVRTPGDVLTDGLGTCLDTTVLLAAALEHVGITPVLWIADGHAFLGYWRGGDLALPDAASLQLESAVNAVDLQLLGVVETTFATREGEAPKDLFRRATQAPLDAYFRGGTAELRGVVDVGMARLMRVYPVPARQVQPDGTVQVIEYAAAAPVEGVRAEAPVAAPSPSAPSVPVPARVQAWKTSLLDLTLRNKLLNLSGPLTQAALLAPHEQLGTLADLLQDGRSVSLRAVDDLVGLIDDVADARALPGDVLRTMLTRRQSVYTNLLANGHRAALDRLRYRARTGLQETGANPLSLCLGRVDYRVGDRELSAPLLLMPVELRGAVRPYRMSADPTGGLTLNLSLLEKLRLEYGFTVPALAELPQRGDADGVDVDAVLRLFREAVASSGVPARVDSDARLAIVGFTGYLLWRDLDEHWRRFMTAPLVNHLITEPTQPFAQEPIEIPDDTLDDVVAAAPIAADGSQAEAIAAARAGRSFVLEGPPGTGKSQTITNILADQMLAGRSVLFVAEKGAALDVVRARLGAIGLLPFTLDLHDHNARPSHVRERLRAALKQHARPDEAGYQAAGQTVHGASATLASYTRRLHEPNGVGLSLYAAHGQLLAQGDGPALAATVDAVAPGANLDHAGVQRAVTAAVPALETLGPAVAQAWGFAREAPTDLAGFAAALERADVAVTDARLLLQRVDADARETLGHARCVDDLRALTWLLSDEVDAPALTEVGTPRWQSAVDELGARLAAVRERATWLSAFGPGVLGVALDPVRQALREAAGSFFLGRKRRLLAAGAPVLAHLRPGAPADPKALPALVEQMADTQQQLGRLVASCTALPGLRSLPRSLNPLSDEGAATLSAALDAAQRDAALLDGLPRTLAQRLLATRRTSAPLDAQARSVLERAALMLGDALDQTGSQPADQRFFCGSDGLLAHWQASMGRRQDDPRFTTLRRWAEAFTPLTALDGLAAARWQLLTKEIEPAQALSALERGLAQASQAERWEAAGLDMFDADAHDRTVQRFVGASAALRESLRTVLPAALLERRPFRAGAVLGTVGALTREIERTRGGLSVRRLMATYGEVIAKITPCVLVSPDSLARFIPPDAMTFDLVVFDEASQIRVPDAIGALGRARACVVAGDSKQMPPTAFMEVTRDEAPADELDFEHVPDEESILGECVQAGLERLWLSWHYRSRDESLIAFSNTQYYENRLSSFPAVPSTVADRGISFVRVQGRFLRSAGDGEGALRTNPVEAQAVVAEVLRRWARGEHSIGVVTFNVQQRGLIEQLLVDSGVPGVAESLDARDGGLFVKNLENVQGDERDVVLFSTGFSANARGVLPLNFGPLNRQGGERRLNVAITRARRRVIVFSSFDPEDLRTEQTSSVGIKHLRGYLEMARDGVTRLVPYDPYGGLVPLDDAPAAVDRHRDGLAEALRARGWHVETGLGLSDFQVDLALGEAGSERLVLAVLLDGTAWAVRRTTADRDGLPLTVLRDVMGWPGVARVWLPAWLNDPDGVLRALDEAAREAAASPSQRDDAIEVEQWARYEETLDDDAPDEPDTWQGVLGAERASRAEPYTPFAGLVERSWLDDAGPLATAHLRSAVADALAAEAPVPLARLARAVVSAAGIGRLQEPRIRQVAAALPPGTVRDDEGFLWAPDGTRSPADWRGYRPSGDPSGRPLTDISLVELANALLEVAERSFGGSPDDLARAAAALFGVSRMTAPARARMAAALDQALARGLLARRDALIVPGSAP